MIDEASLRDYARDAFEFHLVKRPQMDTRVRLPEDQAVGSLTPLELLDLYWRANHTASDDAEGLQKLAQELIAQAQTPD